MFFEFMINSKVFFHGRGILDFLGSCCHITYFMPLLGDLLDDIDEKMSYIL